VVVVKKKRGGGGGGGRLSASWKLCWPPWHPVFSWRFLLLGSKSHEMVFTSFYNFEDFILSGRMCIRKSQ